MKKLEKFYKTIMNCSSNKNFSKIKWESNKDKSSKIFKGFPIKIPFFMKKFMFCE